jgi:hypothetical protein
MNTTERFAFKRAVQKAVQNEYNNTPERYFSPINHPEQSTTYARLDELEIRCSIRLSYAPSSGLVIDSIDLIHCATFSLCARFGGHCATTVP